MAQNISQLAQLIATILCGNPHSSNIWADVWGNVGESMGIETRSTHHLDPGNAAIPLPSSTTASGFAISQHAKRRMRAEAIGVKSRPDSGK